jgi:hypothetical protein
MHMSEPMGTPPAPNMFDTPAGPPRKSNQGLIIGIVAAVLVLCCCLPLTLWIFYQYLGDPLMRWLGLQ